MRVVKAFAALFLVFLVGCSAPAPAPQGASGAASSALGGTGGTADATPVLLLSEAQLQEFGEEHDLAYPDPFSQEYPHSLALPTLLQYEGDTLYFLSEEETPFVGKENTAQTPDPLICKLYAYDCSAKEKREVGPAGFEGYSSGDFLLTGDAFYYHSSVHADRPGMVLSLLRLLRDSKETEELAQIENALIGADYGELENGTVVAMVRYVKGEKDGQSIYKLEPGASLQRIYNSEEQGLAAPEFSALTVYKNSIFLLRQTEQKGMLKSEIVEMDAAGRPLAAIAPPGLEQYADPDYYADELYVLGDYFFIKWYSSDETLPAFCAYRLVNNQPQAVKFSKNSPCRLLSPSLIGGRYLLFSAFPDYMDFSARQYAAHVFLFDTRQSAFIGVHFPFDSDVLISQMVCNEKGDLILEVSRWNEERRQLQPRLLKVDFSAIQALL